MKIILKKKTPKWHKPAKTILVVTLVVFIFWQLMPEREIEDKDVTIVPFIPDEISRDGAYVHVNNIDYIDGPFKWVSDSEIAFSGNHKEKGPDNYLIDIQALTITALQSNDITTLNLNIGDKVAKQVTLMYSRDDLSLYFVADEGLVGIYQSNSDGVRQVSEHMYLDQDTQLPYFLISKDGQKLVYFEDTSGKIVTYSFSTHKKKIIQTALTEAQFKKLSDHVKISDFGGYVSFISDDQLIYVYGADSGRVYVDGVMGENPQFSTEEGFFYYMYEGAMINDYAGTQFGLVDFNKKEINYDTALDGLMYYYDYALLAEDQVLYMTGVAESDAFIIDAVVKFDPTTNEKYKSYELKGTLIKSGTPLTQANGLMVLEKTDGDHLIYNFETQKVTTLTGLSHFISSDGEEMAYIKYESGFIVAYNNAIYRYDPLGSIALMTYDGPLTEISLSPSLKSIAAYIEGSGFIISDKLSEVY